MNITSLLAVIFSIAAGVLYSCNALYKSLAERRLVKLTGFLACEKISSGKELLWYDLRTLYQRTTKKIIGIGGELTVPEGYFLVRFICDIFRDRKNGFSDREGAVRNLIRSMPTSFTVKKDIYFYMAGVYILLFSLASARILHLSDPIALKSLPIVMVIQGVMSVYYLVNSFLYVKTSIVSGRAIRNFRSSKKIGQVVD